MEEDYEGTSGSLGIAELIAVPNDIDYKLLNKHFPNFNKVNALGNMTNDDIMNYYDFNYIKNIQMRSGLTRRQKGKFTPEDATVGNMWITSRMGLSRNGFAVSRLTENYTNVSTSDSSAMPKKTMLGSLFNKGGQQ